MSWCNYLSAAARVISSRFAGLLVVKTVGGAKDGKGTEPLREISLSNYPGAGIVGTAFIADFSTNNDYFEVGPRVET